MSASEATRAEYADAAAAALDALRAEDFPYTARVDLVAEMCAAWLGDGAVSRACDHNCIPCRNWWGRAGWICVRCHKWSRTILPRAPRDADGMLPVRESS